MGDLVDDEIWSPGSAIFVFEPERPNRIVVAIKQAEEKFDNVNPMTYFPVHVQNMFAGWIKPGTTPVQVRDFDTGPTDHEPHQYLPVFIIELTESANVDDWPTNARSDMFDDKRFIKDPSNQALLETIIHPIVPDFVTGICKEPERSDEPLPNIKKHPGLWPPIIGYHAIDSVGYGPPSWFPPQMDPIHPRQRQAIIGPSDLRQGDLTTLGGLRDYIKKGGSYESDQKRLYKGVGFVTQAEEEGYPKNFRPYRP